MFKKINKWKDIYPIITKRSMKREHMMPQIAELNIRPL